MMEFNFTVFSYNLEDSSEAENFHFVDIYKFIPQK